MYTFRIVPCKSSFILPGYVYCIIKVHTQNVFSQSLQGVYLDEITLSPIPDVTILVLDILEVGQPGNFLPMMLSATRQPRERV